LKKQLVLIFAVLLILGFAVDVYAQTPAVANGDTQVTINGEMRFRGRIETRCDTFGGATTEEDKSANQRARYDTKFRVGVLAKVSPKTKAFLQLAGGTADNNHSYTWGGASAGAYEGDAKGGYTTGNDMQSNVFVRNVWLEHTIADLITIKAGHQPIKIGWGLFYDHSLYGDDAIVVTAKPTKEFSISALTAKLNENGFDAGDADLYGLGLNFVPMKGTEISADATYLRDRHMVSGLSSTLGANLVGAQYRLGLMNYGLRAKTKIAALGLRGGIEIQRGTVKDVTGTNSDVKLKGMAAQLGASYDITSDIVLDAELGYGSGDDNGTSDKKIKTFITSRGATTPLTFVYEDETVTSANQGNGGTSNLMYAKVGAKANLTKDLSADLRVYYLKAAKAPKSTVSATERYNFTYATDKKDIGVEVDLYTKYKLDKGLIYFLEGGYLFAGDYWKALTNTQDPKNPWAIKHGLELEF
jgi:hypothetical protein